jgi:hypothetical protein
LQSAGTGGTRGSRAVVLVRCLNAHARATAQGLHTHPGSTTAMLLWDAEGAPLAAQQLPSAATHSLRANACARPIRDPAA